jgi:DNA-directed RNA polymerase subunit L
VRTIRTIEENHTTTLFRNSAVMFGRAIERHLKNECISIIMGDAMFSNISQSKTPDERFTFDISNVDLAIINGIRRTILTDIPVVGFYGEDEPTIEIHANNGPLNNEILINRFGLIPIHISEEETETYDENMYTFELKEENTSAAIKDVTTESFKVFKNNKEVDPRKFFPANKFTRDFILITRMNPQEVLHVTGKAVKKTARTRASFSPVSLCSYRFLGPENGTYASPLDKERDYYKDAYGEPTHVQFSMEVETALTPVYLVRKSLEILIEKVDAVRMNTPEAERTDIGVDYTFQDEDDTLGNILQSNMHNYYIREKNTSEDLTVTYVGYKCPHPLESIVVLRICIQDHANVDISAYNTILIDSCERLIIQLRGILDEWNNVNKV